MPTAEELADRLSALEARLTNPIRKEKEPEKAPEPAPQTFTYEQLKAAVDAGEINEAQMMQLWTQQSMDAATKKVKEEITSETKAREIKTAIEADIAMYVDKIPDCMTPGSEARQRVEREFRRLVNLGYDDTDVRTEHAALVAAFGGIEQIKGKPKKLPKQPEKTEEVHGADGGEPEGDDDDSDTRAPAGMDTEVKRYYKQQIERGLYADWNEVREELKFAKKARKRG